MADAQAPSTSVGSKTLGIHKYDPKCCIGAAKQHESKRRGYEEKYEDDVPGEELSNEARVWRVMLDEGRVEDVALLQRFRDHLDVDLVFAGLFSAVLTTFVAQTSQLPSSNSNSTTVALLLELVAVQRAWANNPRVDGVTSSILPSLSPSSDPSPWINRCWFLSLVFSLLAAFGAVVVRQWLQEYESDITGHPKRRALVQHYRRVGLKRYKVHVIVPILPMLLHVSLLLFFVGLVLYVRQSDLSMSNVIIALTVTIYVLYLVTNVLPVFLPQCPYRSPLATGAHWVKSLVALLYALTENIPPMLSHGRIAIVVLQARLWVELLQIRLYYQLRGTFITVAYRESLRIWKQVHRRLRTLSAALEDSWKKVFRTPGTHEWEVVKDRQEDLVLESLDSMIQTSSDLSVTPLVVQAISNLPYIHSEVTTNHVDSRLLSDRVLPWFINALNTRRMVFKWEPGREHELQRMACSLLLIPQEGAFWTDTDRQQYHVCVSRVSRALVLALRETPENGEEGDVVTMGATLLALGNRLNDLEYRSGQPRNDTLLANIASAYSCLSQRNPPAVLRLRPLIWQHALEYLRCHGSRVYDLSPLAVLLWRGLYPHDQVPTAHSSEEIQKRQSRVTVQEWAYMSSAFFSPRFFHEIIQNLLCSLSYESCKHNYYPLLPSAIPLHWACHAIDSYVKEGIEGSGEGDDLGFLAVQFIESLAVCQGYVPIDRALEKVGTSAVSSLFKSTFLARPALSFVMDVKVVGRLPDNLAVSFLWFLFELAVVVHKVSDEQRIICDVVRALDNHVTNYREILADTLDYDVVSIDPLLPTLRTILDQPQLALLDLSDLLADTLATRIEKAAATAQYSELEKGVIWCIFLDALCAMRAHTAQLGTKTAEASRALHVALLSLKMTYDDVWESELRRAFTGYVPLTLALALRNLGAWKVLRQLVDIEDFGSEDQSASVGVRIPHDTPRCEVLKWFSLFTSDPEEHIHTRPWPDRLPISAFVTFEEAIERMQEGSTEADSQSDAEDRVDTAWTEDASEEAQDESGRFDEDGGREASEVRVISQSFSDRMAGCWGRLHRLIPFRRASPGHEQGTELPLHQGRDGLDVIA